MSRDILDDFYKKREARERQMIASADPSLAEYFNWCERYVAIMRKECINDAPDMVARAVGSFKYRLLLGDEPSARNLEKSFEAACDCSPAILRAYFPAFEMNFQDRMPVGGYKRVCLPANERS
jgi:hypothetical protein